MPYEWVEPEVFVEHQGVTVYHVYDWDQPKEYWYSTDMADCEEESNGAQFDVRDLRVKMSREVKERVLNMLTPGQDDQEHAHRAMIIVAIEEGLLNNGQEA